MSVSDCQAVNIRKAAVAGQFYPGSEKKLRMQVEECFAAAKKINDKGNARLLISPHAGYVFSGPVAAHGFLSIDKSTTRVFILGPSHYDYFHGIALSQADFYETPLGKVPVDKRIVSIIRDHSMVCELPAAEAPEHCLEVQLPFLQVKLSNFTIIPMLLGKVDPEIVASIITPFVDKNTIVVASSDLSHYHAHQEARQIDDRSVAAIMKGNVEGNIDGCGANAIKVVMHIAKKLGYQSFVLDNRNSYETAPHFGSDSRVVGYASIIYIDKKENGAKSESNLTKVENQELTHADKSFLLSLARKSLEACVKGNPLPKVQAEDIPKYVLEHRGCFVTLHSAGQLRGCIGCIEPIKPLFEGVIDNARNAALRDPRFIPVAPEELLKINVEVSVLTKPVLIEYSSPEDLLDKIVPGKDSIILEKGYHQSTFLPQVWEQLPDKTMFLEHLSMKAGLSRDGWKGAIVKRYYAEHFQEDK